MRTRASHPRPYGGQVPSARGSATSKAAAPSQPVFAGRVRRIYEYIRGRGEEGATREEVAQWLTCRPSDVSSSVRFLYLRGWIGPEGTRLSTRSNKRVEVMKHYSHVRRWKGSLTADMRALLEHGELMESGGDV